MGRFSLPILLLVGTALLATVSSIRALAPQGERSAQEELVPDRALGLARELSEPVARFRGLPWKRPVDIASYTLDDLERLVVSALDRDLPDPLARSRQRALSRFGLLPESYDLKRELRALLVEQIGGFYDPDAAQLRVVRRTEGTAGDLSPLMRRVGLDSGALDRIVMAHELVHALQDQHYDLKAYPLDLQDEDDLVMAVASLVEGDATLAMMGFVLGGERISPESLFERGRQIAVTMKVTGFGGIGGGAMRSFGKAPKFMKQSLMFPYVGGLAFIVAAGSQGKGYAGVAPCFDAPPLSTEQILHPHKGLGGDRDDPWVLRLPDLAPLLGLQSRLLHANTFGEMFTVVLMQQAFRKREASAVAAGWGGDRYAVYERPGDPDAAVWLTTWDDAKEADEFEEGLIAWASRREGAKPSEAVDWAPWYSPRADGTVDVIVRRDRDVLLLLAVPRDSVVRLAREVLTRTQRSRRTKMPRREPK